MNDPAAKGVQGSCEMLRPHRGPTWTLEYIDEQPFIGVGLFG